MTTQANPKLEKLKAARQKIDKQIRSEAAKAGVAERKRKARQKHIVGGAIIGSLASISEHELQTIVSILEAKTSDDDKKALSDLITFKASVRCNALDYL